MLTRNKWGIPIPAISRLLISRLWLNRCLFAGLFIESNEPSILRLCINGIRVVRVGCAFKTITSVSDKPIIISDPSSVDRLRWSAQGVVILGSAVYIIKGPVVIDRYAIKLYRRKVCSPIPTLHFIPCFIQTAVCPNDHMRCIARVNPQAMVVNMLEFFRYVVKVFPAVATYMSVSVHAIKCVDLIRMSD